VIRADEGGPTWYLTSWLAAVFPGAWNAFCEKVHPGLKPPCGPTVAYPQFGGARAENGPNNVLAFITSPAGNGAIGYAEAVYPIAAHMPMLSLGNAAGDFVQPTAANVTASLSRALIDENPHSPRFMQVNLASLYASKSPANYPLSFTSYVIVPRLGTRLPANFSKAKGRSLSTFLVFALCGGQQQMRQLGYAPLPGNLVQGGLLQVANIPGHIHVPSKCTATRAS
jgi:ABC-type phosphate transport system substrate-binding protein